MHPVMCLTTNSDCIDKDQLSIDPLSLYVSISPLSLPPLLLSSLFSLLSEIW